MDQDQGVSRDHAPGIGSVASGQSHTRGPWEVRYRFGRLTTVVGRQRFPICDTGTAPVAQANDRREEANARLIAAAPEMHDALIEAERFLDYFASDRRSFVGSGTPRSALEQVRAAIAKATQP